MQRQEIDNYTEEQIMECIEFALMLVDEIKPPGDLRLAVFQAAREMRGAKQILMQQGPPVLGIGRG